MLIGKWSMRVIVTGWIVFWMLAGSAQAAWPRNEGAMVHVNVGFAQNAIEVSLEGDPQQQLPLLNFGETYEGNAAVLSNKFYSDQYGIKAAGFLSLPENTAIWLQLLSQTPGLETYEGGMRMHTPMHTYAPLFTTNGSSSIWSWGGTMAHNWYAAAAPGEYEATYLVYLGTPTGVPLTQYASDTVTLRWKAVPEPSAAVLLAAGASWCMLRRKRSCTHHLRG